MANGMGAAGRVIGRVGGAAFGAASNRRSGGNISPMSNKRPS